MEVDNEEEEDDDAILLASLHHRGPSLWRKRWDSEYLRDLAEKENSFLGEYRMDPKSFDVLLQVLGSSLDRNKAMAKLAMTKCKSGEITAASRLGAALIMLGGGRHMEAMRTHGISRPQAFKNFHDVVEAINSCPALDITYDTKNVDVLNGVAEGFKNRSGHDIFKKCVGAIDGLAIKIQCPSKNEVLNQAQYYMYSGSKKFYCINMQGVCDANCKFMVASCRHVGSTNDAVSFKCSSLKAINESLTFPFHWVGDAAYICTEQMIVPYEGINLHIVYPPKDWFNFWQSQVRITVERCFGIFIARWGIFWSCLRYNLHHCVGIIHACCRLHNFLIERNIPVRHVERRPAPSTCRY